MIQSGRGKMIQSEIIYFDSVLKYFQDIFIETAYSYHKKLNDTGMSEKCHFFFRMLKMCDQLYHFAPWQNMKHEG